MHENIGPAADKATSVPRSQPTDAKMGETMAHGDGGARNPGESFPSLVNAEQWIGRQIDRYEIRSLLGAGGMGVVFLAHDTTIERNVALKMLPVELSSNETALARFLSEAKAAGKLTHPNAVAIYEVDREGDAYYLVMEYVGGGTIDSELERGGALSVLTATQIAADACKGLAAAHCVGLVHRDIKPANLLRASDGSVKIADFGLAKQTIGATMQLTREGAVAGTPYYMSPEQCESRPVDARSDIYSLGATYYSLLTGAHPYEESGSIVQIMFAHVGGPPLDPRAIKPTLPAACTQIVQRATAKRLEDRYQSANEMLADLNAVIATLSGATEIALPSRSGTGFAALNPPATPPPVAKPDRRAWLAAAGLGIVGLAAGAGGFIFLRDEKPAVTPVANPAPLPLVPSGPPILVGILHSLSGSMEESESPVVDATLLSIEEINRAGGVLGRPIQPIVRDGRSEPSVFAEQTHKLLTEDKVCTIFGCWTSAARKTIVPIIERHGNLLIYPVQYEGLEESPNVVYLGAVPNQQITPALAWLFAFRQKRRFFLVGSDYVFPRAANAIIRDQLKTLGGEIVGEEYLPLGTFDVQSTVDKIVAAKPDAILNTINGDTNVPFFARLRAAKITPGEVSTISFSVGEQELRRLDSAAMAGDYAAWNYFQSLDNPSNQHFVAAFREKYGPQRSLTDPMEAAYVGVKLWASAVEKAASCQTDRIRHALRGQKFAAPEGEITICPETLHAFKTPRIGQITSDGQFEIVWTDVKPVAPQPFPSSRTRADWEAFLSNLYREWDGHWAAPAK
jgi:urea transport system substrate-binding protein